MAGCIEEAVDGLPDWTRFNSNLNEQIDEIEALKSYYENTDYLEIFEEASQSENKKFTDWYEKTKSLYKSNFDYEAPNDIWPSGKIRFSEIHFQRVNIKRNWVIKKPSFLKK